jgi:small-conductance mechanosensitive channel
MKYKLRVMHPVYTASLTVQTSKRANAFCPTRAATTKNAAGFIRRIVIWSVITLVARDSMGINITTVVASLGIGGVAVSLAVRNILGDLFASLSTIPDKPFVIGDFLIIDELMGSLNITTVVQSYPGSAGLERLLKYAPGS